MLRKDWTRCTWLSTHLYKEIDGQMSCTRFSFCCLQFQQLLIPTRAICHTHPQSNRTWISAAFPESFSKFQRDILLPVTPQLICSFAGSYAANLVIKLNYAKVKCQKSNPDHIGKICTTQTSEVASYLWYHFSQSACFA